MLLLSSFLLACVPGSEPGALANTAEPVACLAVDGAPLPDETGDAGPWGVEVDGTTLAEGDPDGIEWAWGVRCDEAVRALTLVDGAGAEWHVAWGWSEGGFDKTPATTFGPSEAVHLIFRFARPFGESAGFALTDDADRLVAALEVGTYGPALLEDDVPDLSVRDGLVTGTERDDCGLKEARELDFDGGVGEVTLEPIDSAPLNVGGVETTAWALANFGFRDATCPDISGERSWAVWR